MRIGDDDPDPPIEFEPWNASDTDGHDVDFRRPAHRTDRRRRPVRWLSAAVAVAGLAAVAVMLGRTDGDDRAVPAAPSSSTTATAAATTTVPTDPTTAAGAAGPSTVTTPTPGPAPDRPGRPSWSAYLSGAGEGITAVDLATGGVAETALRRDAAAVVAGPAGPLALAPIGTEYGSVAVVGDGTMWALGDEELVRLRLDDGQEVERQELAAAAAARITDFVDIVGTSETARPVVVLDDALPYEVGADGGVRRYADGPVFGPFRAGRFATTNCTFAGDCSLVLYPAPDTLVLDATARVVRISFSPDGAHVAVFERGDHIRPSSLRLVDARSGQVTRIDVEDSRSTGVAEQGWSPDSTAFAFLSGRRLRVHDVTTDTTTTLVDDVPRDAVLLGVA